jgi:3-oxoacyl-[acyl-carrier-protein] synthase II
VEGRSAFGPLTAFDGSDLPCRIAGEVRDFAPERHINPRLKPGKRMSRTTQFAIAAASMALEDAGLGVEDLGAEEVPVVVGVSSSAMDVVQDTPKPWTAFSVIPHATASGIVYALEIEATMRTVSDGCASGLDAVETAAEQVRRGKAEIAIAGASDSMMTRWVFECFAKLRGLSSRNDDPARASRPFDRDRDGGIISEGAGMLILETVAHARARGARIYAEIAGYGTRADSPSGSEGSGLESAIRAAIANSSRMPGDIEYISAHGPSDQHMDRIESELLCRVFGRAAARIPVTSIKGVTGNPMSVGSLMQVIAACLSMRRGLLPPTANLEHPDAGCEMDHVTGGAREAAVGTVLVNTHGFGRGNSAMVLQRVDGA